jgi:hypothetical protein
LAALALLFTTTSGVLAEGIHSIAASRPVMLAQASGQTAQASPLSALPISVQQQIAAAAAQANADQQANENNQVQQELGADEGAAGGPPATTDLDPGNYARASAGAEAGAEGADEAGADEAGAAAEAEAEAKARQLQASAVFATSSVETSVRRRE